MENFRNVWVGHEFVELTHDDAFGVVVKGFKINGECVGRIGGNTDTGYTVEVTMGSFFWIRDTAFNVDTNERPGSNGSKSRKNFCCGKGWLKVASWQVKLFALRFFTGAVNVKLEQRSFVPDFLDVAWRKGRNALIPLINS